MRIHPPLRRLVQPLLAAACLLPTCLPLAAQAHPDHQQPSHQSQRAGESSQHHHH